MMEDPTPIAIRRASDNTIEIEFDDGRVTRWTARRLRSACPCATCREKKRGEEDSIINEKESSNKPAMLPVISQAEARPLTIEGMRPVGQYGYSILFSDGHSSGIFQFRTLHDDAGTENTQSIEKRDP